MSKGCLIKRETFTKKNLSFSLSGSVMNHYKVIQTSTNPILFSFIYPTTRLAEASKYKPFCLNE